MDKILGAVRNADIVLDNSRFMWLVYITFLVTALIARRTDNTGRRKAANVMTVASIPGVIISLVCLVLFITAVVKGLAVLDGCHAKNAIGYEEILWDDKSMKHLKDLCQSIPIGLLFISIFLVPLESITYIICGAVILKEGGRKSGTAAVITGILFIIGAVIFAFAFIRAIGDP